MSSLPSMNKQVVLAERPGRGPITEKTFKKDAAPLKKPADGEVVVKTEYVSIDQDEGLQSDPAMRGWLNDVRSYLPPVKIGEVMRAGGLGRVVESRSDKYKVGDLVYGTLGWQEYWVGPASQLESSPTPDGMKDIDHLGLLGVSGMTAYFGIFDIGRMKDGETVCISGAAGSVGLIVAQIALAHKKCKVIAIAGSQDKVDELKKMGCHVVLNYKDKDFAKGLRAAGRIDVYFDNVGGEMLDMVLAQINPHARIVLCGAISQYNSAKPYGIMYTPQLISMKAKMEGFIAFDFEKRYPEGRAYLASLAKANKLDYSYYVVDGGLDGCVPAILDMFSGKNYGKTVVSFKDAVRGTKL